MADYCEPCVPPSDPKVDNPLGLLEPNTPAGGSGIGASLPPNPPAEAPGPIDPGISIDTSDPDYAGNYPRQDLATFDQWCGKVPTFKMIQGLIMNMLANHFSDPKNIIDPFLRQYTWTGDTATSTLILNVEEDWDPNIIDRKPAINIKRMDVDIQKLSINDMEQGTIRTDGKKRYAILFVGSHTLRCYGSNSAPPDSLAFEAATLIARAAPVIRNYLSLAQLRVTKITAKVRDDTDPAEAYSVNISVPWAFWYRFETNQVAPALQFIDISFFR